MKFFDDVLDRVIEMSKPIASLAASMKSCVEGLEKLASGIAILAHNQEIHQRLINQLWANNQQILQKLSDSALDTSFPSHSKQDDSSRKPN